MATNQLKNYQTFPYFNIKRVVKMAIILAVLALICLVIPADLIEDNVSGRSITYVRTSLFMVWAGTLLFKAATYNLYYIRRVRKLGLASRDHTSAIRAGFFSSPYQKELEGYNVSYPGTNSQELRRAACYWLWILATIIIVMVLLGTLASK